MEQAKFKVGDKVVHVVSDRFDRYESVATVARVLKRFVQLDDGTKWSHYGFPYPNRWSIRRIHLLTPEISKKRNWQIRVAKARAHAEWLRNTRDEATLLEAYELTKHLRTAEDSMKSGNAA